MSRLHRKTFIVIIEETVREVLKDLTIDEAKFQIREILCPGHLIDPVQDEF